MTNPDPMWAGQPPHQQPHPQTFSSQGQQIPPHTQFAPEPPAKKNRKIWPWIAAVAVVGIIIATTTGNGDDDATAASDGGSGSAVTGEEAAAGNGEDGNENTVPIGQPARDGKFEFTVTDIERSDSVGDEYLSAQAQGEYVLLNVTVTNIGNESHMLSDSSQYLYDAQGKEFAADSEAGMYAAGSGGDSVWLSDINPGNTVEGTMVFDLPEGTDPVTAELHDSPFSQGVTISLR